MSTNYYLINKKQKKVKEDLDVLIEKELGNMKMALLKFGEKENLSIEEEIEDKLRTILNTLEWGLFYPEEIHICKTTTDFLIWQTNEHYIDEDSFVKFFEENKDKYNIENEYEEIFSIDDFLKKISGWKNKKVKYVGEDFL
jgi:hypothetical protein